MPVKIDDTHNHMHHKFMVTDDHTLLTGSYNWTRSAADFNQENVLLTTNGQLVADYVRVFNRLWREMCTFTNEL